MRIAWIIYGGLDQVTGGYIYDRLVIERLRARGDEVVVESLEPVPRSSALAGAALGRRLARLRPEVVVGDELCFREIAPAFAALPAGVARVLLVHYLSQWELPAGPPRAAVALAEGAAMRASDAHLATSATTAARLRREHGLARVDVAPPGADRLPRLPRATRGEGAPRLLFVGSWLPRKRLLALLAAFERVGDPRAELMLLGDPGRDLTYAARVRAAIEGSLFLRERVIIGGLVGDEALAAALAEADALVLASSFEGYGMVLTEAIHAGLPVVATRTGAVAEVVRDGEEALICEGEGDLATALGRFLGDADLRARMGAAAEARAPGLPTWDGTADAVRATITRATRNRRGRRPRGREGGG